MTAIDVAEYDRTFGTAWHPGKDVRSRMTYTTNAGSPVGSVTPAFIGQVCYDTTNKDFYVATDTAANTDWAAMAFPDLSPTELNILDGATATAAEINYLDIAALGTGAASKAVVLDGSGNYKMPDGGVFKFSADTVAAAGSSSSDAAALSDQITVVTGADGAKGVVLPAAADLEERTVVNDSQHYALKVYPVDSGDDTINELAANEEFNLGPEQEVTFKAVSATAWYADRSKSRPARTTHFEIFDDFTYEAIATTGAGRGDWIVFAGTDADATAAAVVPAPEGKVDMGSGDGGSTEDGSVISLILLAKGSLVSLGMTVFECRVSFDQITGVAACFGLSDALATDDEHLLHTIVAGELADGGLSVTNSVEIVYSEEATAGTVYQIASENGGTIGNSGAEESLTDGPTIDTYDTLRIEVDDTGAARFYINGVLRGTRALAVATTALLIPYIAIDGEAATPVVTDLSIDYIYFAGHRPSSNA